MNPGKKHEPGGMAQGDRRARASHGHGGRVRGL